MLINKNITVIIPSKENDENLEIIINSIIYQDEKPIEIIIINANKNENTNKDILIGNCRKNKIILIYINAKDSLPGNSRNLGIENCSTELLMFLDVKTIPTKTYISETLKLQKDLNCEVVFGATRYKADSKFQNLIRDSIYGCNTITTLPGTLLRKKDAQKVGSFIDWIRSGEDLEWISRVKLLKMNVVDNKNENYLIYTGLENCTLKTIIIKWNEYYKESINLHTYDKYIKILLILFYPIIFLIAYNWNSFFANWQENSPLYIAHLTKYIIIFPFAFYLVFRGMIIPIRKGVKLTRIFPFRWISIVLLCLLIDTIKFKCLLQKNYEIRSNNRL